MLYIILTTSPKGIYMDIETIVAQLRQEISRIEGAIAALLGTDPQPARRGRPPKASGIVRATGKRRRLSAAARARISAAMKQRWARQKGAAAPKKAPAQKKASGRKPMSPAMRKKLSAMMKRRWAARKRAA